MKTKIARIVIIGCSNELEVCRCTKHTVSQVIFPNEEIDLSQLTAY